MSIVDAIVEVQCSIKVDALELECSAKKSAEYVPTEEEISAWIDRRRNGIRRSGNSHYGIGMYPDRLSEWATPVALSLRQYLRSHPGTFPILVFRGMSGVSTATTLSLKLFEKGIKHAKLYVRKEGEKSHGADVEGNGFEEYLHSRHTPLFVFVDDFIDQGKTATAVLCATQRDLRVEVRSDNTVAALGSSEELRLPGNFCVNWEEIQQEWEEAQAELRTTAIQHIQYDRKHSVY